MVIGRLATFDSSSVTWPSQPGSMKPAVEWISRPSRPSELFPSSRATRSSGSRTRSSVEPSTNSPGWRTNGCSPSTSTSSVSSACSTFTSMNGQRLLWKTRKKRSTRTSTLDGCSSAASYGSISILPSASRRAIVASESTIGAILGGRDGWSGYRGAVAVTRAIELRTQIPGPRSREILERKERVVADPLGVYLPIVIAEGSGAIVTDVDGNSFVDFTGGVGCLNVGHAHPRVVAALQEQAAHFLHTDFTIVPYEIYVEYAERLTAIAPFAGPTKAAFFNAGTEAVENAVKFARGYTRRPAVIGFEGGFHGRT